MATMLEKALKDSIKEDKCVIGARQVQSSIGSAKLIVLSGSAPPGLAGKIGESAPIVMFDGTSVALGRLCGLQFRVSAVSFSALSAALVKSIVNESNKGKVGLNDAAGAAA